MSKGCFCVPCARGVVGGVPPPFVLHPDVDPDSAAPADRTPVEAPVLDAQPTRRQVQPILTQRNAERAAQISRTPAQLDVAERRRAARAGAWTTAAHER